MEDLNKNNIVDGLRWYGLRCTRTGIDSQWSTIRLSRPRIRCSIQLPSIQPTWAHWRLV